MAMTTKVKMYEARFPSSLSKVLQISYLCVFTAPNIPPVATCPDDVAEFSLVNNVGNFVSFADSVCTDNEDPPGSIPAVCDRQSGSFFQGIGQTVVTCTCTDSAGASNSCTFNVNVLEFVGK